MSAPNAAAVMQRIRRYLDAHPNAADTLQGVAVWWLEGNASEEWLSIVTQAMDQLVASGEVARRRLTDGTTIYERNKQAGPH